MSLATLCYGEEGSRLEQAFQLTFENRDQPFAILLKGDSGIGKTYILQQLAQKYNAQIKTAQLGQLAAKHRGQLSKGLKRIIWNAEGIPSVVVLDDVDLFFPRDETHDLSLLEMVKRLINDSKVMVVATTRRPDAIPTNIRSLFSDEIQLQIPTPNERFHIMQHICQSYFAQQAFTVSEIQSLASMAHAFIAADVAQWCRLAEENAITNNRNQIERQDFIKTFDQVRVSGLQNASMAEKPDPIHWHDIGGLKDAKKALEESAVWVYKHADAYKRLGIRPSKGVLLFGPPGTGKTLLAKAVATESSANFLPVSIPDLIKGEVGESEKAVSRIFQTAIRCSPCVIFLDELEAIFSSRETSGDVGRKLISQFLIEIDHLDKLDQHVILLGATNHPESIDDSILRPGRLDRLVYVGAPNLEERVQILNVLQQKTKLDTNVDLESIALKAEGYTGADLKAVVRKAGLLSLKSNLKEVTQENLELALNYVSPSIIPS